MKISVSPLSFSTDFILGSGGLSVAHQIYNRFKGAGKSLNAGDIAIVDGAKDHYYQVREVRIAQVQMLN